MCSEYFIKVVWKEDAPHCCLKIFIVSETAVFHTTEFPDIFAEPLFWLLNVCVLFKSDVIKEKKNPRRTRIIPIKTYSWIHLIKKMCIAENNLSKYRYGSIINFMEYRRQNRCCASFWIAFPTGKQIDYKNKKRYFSRVQ